jgi:hypothetical protein
VEVIVDGESGPKQHTYSNKDKSIIIVDIIYFFENVHLK